MNKGNKVTIKLNITKNFINYQNQLPGLLFSRWEPAFNQSDWGDIYGLMGQRWEKRSHLICIGAHELPVRIDLQWNLLVHPRSHISYVVDHGTSPSIGRSIIPYNNIMSRSIQFLKHMYIWFICINLPESWQVCSISIDCLVDMMRKCNKVLKYHI